MQCLIIVREVIEAIVTLILIYLSTMGPRKQRPYSLCSIGVITFTVSSFADANTQALHLYAL